MRSLPHSVAVVTALAENPSLQPRIDPATNNVELLSPYYHDFCGATISSLQSVTLGPPAIISFNLKMPSRTLNGLLHHKQFGIHLLLSKDPGQEVADAFIRQPHFEAFRALSQSGCWVGLGLSPIEKAEDLEKRIPLIRGVGVFSFLRCEVLADKCVQVGDHMVVIAKVASIGLDEATLNPQNKNDRNTLAYVHGAYHEISSLSFFPKHQNSKALKLIPIRRNSLHIHNDALGISPLSMEATLAKFCQQVRHELPERLQGHVSELLLRDVSWFAKAHIMQLARESQARGEHPTFELDPELWWQTRRDLKLMLAKFEARSPSNFWGCPPEDWPNTSPPWHDGIEPPADLPDRVGDYPSYIRIKGDNAIQASTRDGRQPSMDRHAIPKAGSDPLGAIGEEEDGDLSSLTEEGYRNLAKKVVSRKKGQCELMNGEVGERSEEESIRAQREDLDSVDRSERTHTGLPPEEEEKEILKNSSP
ncbi:hypothetical protein E2P81_ATG09231 [Venturia nashicola]|uniref:Flavin reductase like domain-containing protein n=1 Tax=Venturia nashicola TaxID=86259 RepID=A0A4Z1NUF5_9PEZI|nr:hypothetical protein E6O75_ATG09434 [Venturia nashicola]TLD20161.1 hypothetical protein E2P81_ATG09231 [Venturia nashicola]